MVNIYSKEQVDALIPGNWTARTANDDWSDLFDIDANNKLVAKKDIYMYYENGSNNFTYTIMCYIPKGLTADEICIMKSTNFLVGAVGVNYRYIYMKYTDIPSTATSLTVALHQNAYTFDSTTDTITQTMNVTSETLNKSDITIFTK